MILIVIEKQREGIFLPLATFLIESQLVTEVAIQQGWEERGAERESDPRQRKWVLGEVQVGLVRAERDQCGVPSRCNMR